MKTKILQKTLCVILACALFLSGIPMAFAEGAESATQLYVAVNGDDSAEGTIDAPLKTLEAARDKIRKMKENNAYPADGVIVNIREGVYSRLEDSFALGSEDSGKEGAPVIYRAYPGEKVEIVGNMTVAGSKFTAITDEIILNRLPESVRDKVLVYDIGTDAGVTTFAPIQKNGAGWSLKAGAMNVLVDGVVQNLSRYPNEGFLPISSVISKGFSAKDHWVLADGTCPGCSTAAGTSVGCEYDGEEEYLQQKGGVFTSDGEELKNKYSLWTQETDIWARGYFCWKWADDSCPVDSVEQTSTGIQLSLGQPSRYGVGGGDDDNCFYVFNLLCEIDEPGEWYLDRENAKLYLYPTKDISGSNVEMTMQAKPFVTMTDVKYVEFQGISMSKANGHGIVMINCENCTIAGCKLSDFGQLAIYVGDPYKTDKNTGSNGGKNNTILSCDITRTGQGAIYLGGGNRYTLTPANNQVINCDISDFSVTTRTYAPAVALVGCGNKVLRNRMYDAPHSAILISGNDHLIEGNEIFDVCYETQDCGAIYTGRRWSEYGTVIKNNYIHDITNDGGIGSAGVYLDDTQSGVTVTENLFVNLPGRMFLIGGGHHNVLTNNIQINQGNGKGISYDNRGEGWGAKFAAEPNGEAWLELMKLRSHDDYDEAKWEAAYPNLATLDLTSYKDRTFDGVASKYYYVAARPHGSTVTGNIMVGVQTPDDIHANVKTYSTVENNPTYAKDTDIGFTNVATGNYTVKADSIIKDVLGDNHFDWTKVGIYNDAYRTLVIDATSLVAPANGATKLQSGSELRFEWEAVSGVTSYILEIATDEGFSNIEKTISTQKEYVFVSGLQKSTTYYWRVKTIGMGATPPTGVSEIFTFTTSVIVDTSFFESFYDFKAWETREGTPTRSDAQAKTGNYSFYMNEDTDRIQKVFGENRTDVVKIYLYDNMQTEANTTAIATLVGEYGVALGVNSDQDGGKTHYVYRDYAGDGKWTKTAVSRSPGWHELKFDFTSGEDCEVYIDNTWVLTSKLSSYHTIQLGDSWTNGTASHMYFDKITAEKPAEENILSMRLPESQVELVVEDTHEIKAFVETPTDRDVELEYVSDNEEVATVDENGVVTAVAKGTATITVSSKTQPEKSVTLKVTVDDSFFEGFYDFEAWVTRNGTPTRSDAQSKTGNYSFYMNEDVDRIEKVFGKNRTDVVKIYLYDNMQAGASTTAIATLIGEYGTGASSILLGVNSDQDGGKTHYVYRDYTADDTQWKKINVSRSPGWHELKFDFTSGQNCKVYIDNTLVLTSKLSSYHTIQLGDSWTNGTASHMYFDSIIAGDPPVEENILSMSLPENQVEMDISDTYEIKAFVETDPDRDVELEYVSNNEAVATVDKNGVVTAIAEGTATITVRSKTHTDKYVNLNVTVRPPIVVEVPVIASKVYNGTVQTADVPESTLYTVVENAGGTNAGTYTVTLELVDSQKFTWANSNEAQIDLSFVITQASTTHAAPTANAVIYNGKNQNLITAGSANGGQMQYSTDNVNWSADIPQATNAGTYTVYYKVVGDNNHTDSAVGSVNVTINRRSVTVTADDASKIYGDDDPAELTWTVTSDTELENEALIINSSRTEGENVGTYTITVSQEPNANPNYDITFVNGTFTINKAPLTVTAENKTAVYGDLAPQYTVIGTGFKNGETLADLGGTLSFACDYAQFNDKGTYTITPSGYESGNYEISYVPGTLTVNPKAITVTIANKTSGYGEDIVELTATDNGIVNNDTNVYSLATTATKTSDIGKYDIVGTALNDNYIITFENGEDAYEITKTEGLASVSIDGWIYGENEKAPVPVSDTNGVDNVTYLYKVKGAEDSTYTATVPTQAGEYTVKATFAATENYNATTATADFRITKREVTVTAKNAAKTYGDIDSMLTWEVTSGSVLSDDFISVSISRANGENVGTYAITVSQSEGANPNYDITFVNGTFTINKAPLTVTAENKTAVYGDLAPQYTVIGTGFKNGETLADLGGTLSFACDYAQFDDKGTYTITPSGYESGNYEISYVPGTLTVNPKAITVTIANKTSGYGEDIVELTATDNGIVNNDTNVYSLATTATSIANVGTYPITGTALDANYDITFVDGTYTITKVQAVGTAPTAVSGLVYNKNAQTLVAAGSTNDGTMLYSLEQNGTYLPELPKATAAGTYKVWYTVVGDNNHTDGEIAFIEVKIDKADPSVGTVTAGVVNDTLETSAIVLTRTNTNVAGNLIVDAGQTLVLGENEIAYTFVPTDSNYKAVTGTVIVTVADTIAPTGTVTIATNNWTDFLNNITFGLFFKETQTVSVVASDNLSGVAKIEYIESKTAMDLDAVKAATQWTEMGSGSISVTLEDTKQFVYYIRITDKSGNVSYLSSDGAEYDTSAPVVAGVNNGATYYTTQKVTINDKNIDTVTLNGEAATSTITLEGNKEATYIIVATDKAGNTTTVTVKMAPIADIAESMDGMTSNNVTSADKTALQTIVDAVTELLRDEELPAEEKEALEKAKADAEALLTVIENAAKAADTENTDKVEDVTADNVTPDDKSDLEKAKADLEKALADNGGNYTAEEKKAIEDELKRIDDALKVIENVENVEDAISNLPATVEPDDEETIAKIEAAKKSYDELTDYEKSLVNPETKEKLDKLTDGIVAYDIVKGDGSSWTQGTDGSITFTVNGLISKFSGIKIDGKAVDAQHYDVRAGSTIITLKAAYLETLAVGKHSITVFYTDGETSGTFNVQANSTIPATGDNSHMMLWSSLMIVSCAAILVLLNYKRIFSYGGKYSK